MTTEFNRQLQNINIQITRMEASSLQSEAANIPKDPNEVLAEMKELETFTKKALDISTQLYEWYRLPLESFFLKQIAKRAQQNTANAIRIQQRVHRLLEIITGDDIFVQQELGTNKQRLLLLQARLTEIPLRTDQPMRPYDAVSRLINILLRTEFRVNQSLRDALLENLAPYVERAKDGDPFFHFALTEFQRRLEGVVQLGSIPSFWFDHIIEQYSAHAFHPIGEMDDSLITKERDQ